MHSAQRLAAHGCFLVAAAALIACDGTDGDVLLRRPVPGTAAKLLAFGQDIPKRQAGLVELHQRIGAAEAQPFDGMVMDLGFSRDLMTAKPIDRAAHAGAVSECRSIPFRKLTENFQSHALAATKVDWFDDAAFAVIAQNHFVAAELIRAAGLRGFFVDNQVYGLRIWSYPDVLRGLSFAQVEAKVSERGEAIMAAIVRAFPDALVLLNWGSSEILRQVCIERQSLETHLYGLYPAFLEGMERAIVSARAPARIVDAYLPAYPTRDPEAFSTYYHLIHFDWERLVQSWKPGIVTHWDSTLDGMKRFPWRATPEQTCDRATLAKLGRNRDVGFGVMIDYEGQPFQTDPALFDRNYFSPTIFEDVLTAALQRADRYAWVWQESFNTWGRPSINKPLMPAAYVDAIVRARQRAGVR